MQGRRYTQKEDETLINLRNKGVSVPEIAKTLNRSKYSVHGRITRLRSLRLTR